MFTDFFFSTILLLRLIYSSWLAACCSKLIQILNILILIIKYIPIIKQVKKHTSKEYILFFYLNWFVTFFGYSPTMKRSWILNHGLHVFAHLRIFQLFSRDVNYLVTSCKINIKLLINQAYQASAPLSVKGYPCLIGSMQ